MGFREPDAHAPSRRGIFYLPDDGIRGATVARMRAAGFEPVAAFNPCWDRRGVTFEDPDGYRIVLRNAPWQV